MINFGYITKKEIKEHNENWQKVLTIYIEY